MGSDCISSWLLLIFLLYCYLTVDILTKVLQKCSLSSRLPNVSFLSNPLNLIGCHGNRKA